MANICNNQYEFVFSDEEKAKRFLDFINKDASVYELGVAAKIDRAEKRDVRESIYHAEIDKSTVNVYTESKWTPCPNAWEDIAKTFDENVIVYYEAEEPGCEIYASNDPDYVGHFIIDVWDDSDLPEGVDLKYVIYSRVETISILQKLLKTDTDNMSVLLYKLGNSKYKEVVFVHEIEYTPISDWAL